MKHSIQAVSEEGVHVEVAEKEIEYDALKAAKLASEFCPLASIHVYRREPFELADGTPENGRFRLILVTKFKDGEEVK